MGSVDDILKKLNDAINEYNSKKNQLGFDVEGKKREIENLSKEANKLAENYKTSKNEANKLKDTASAAMLTIGKNSKEITKDLTSLKTEGNDIDDFFSSVFGNLYAGLNKGNGGFQNISESAGEFAKVLKNVDGANVAFWREYDRRIREVGVTYGISGKKLDQFREGNLNLEKEFVRTGQSIDQLDDGIYALLESTGQVNQLTPDFGKNLGNISRVMGLTVGQTGTLLGSFNNLGLSFNTTTKLLEDLRYSAEKSALNTQKVLNTFSQNFERLNTFAFKNGVQGMMEMVKQSQALKVNMDKVLDLADSFTDPEQTMQFASNIQLLGGSFAQLGDFNKLMYDAAVAPEELAKNIAKASAGMGQFNRETGKLDISFADKMQLKEAAKLMGMTVQDLQKMSTIQAKIADMKSSLNFKPLSEDQLNTLASVAQFNTKSGQYEVKVDGKMKSVASLSDEDIDKLSAAGEQQTFEQLNVQKMDVPEIIATNLQVAKFDTPDFFKSMGLTSENLKKEVNESARSLEGAMGMFKEKFAKPFEDFVGSAVGDNVAKMLRNIGDASSIALGMMSKAFDEFKNSNLGKSMGKAADQAIEGVKQGIKGEKGGILNPDKFEEGKILEGLSHKDGGIPFTIGGKPGFEAEGGEILLTKGVSQDPTLLSIASKVNESAGGKKLYADGGITPTTNNVSNVTQTNNSFLMNTINNENINNINNLYKQINSSIKEDIQKTEILNNNITNVYDKLNDSLQKFTVVTTKNLNEFKLDYKTPNLSLSKQETRTFDFTDQFSKLSKLISEFAGKIDKETGKINFSFGDRLKIKGSADEMGLDFKELFSQIKNILPNINLSKPLDAEKRIEQIFNNITNDLKTDISTIDTRSKNIGQSFNNISNNLMTNSNIVDNKTKNIEQSFTNISSTLKTDALTNINKIKNIEQPIGSVSKIGFGNYAMPDFKKIIIEGLGSKENISENKNRIIEQAYTNLSNNIKYSNVNTDNTKKLEQISNVFTTKNENITKMIDKTQGGLVEKRGDMSLGNVGVNGSVQVTGKIDPINVKVSIEGSTSTKEMVLSDDKLQNKIHSIVSERINNMNIYTQFLTKKDTGIDSGKKPVIHGITDVG